MKPYYKHELIPLAQKLRRNATKQENHLWYDYFRTFPVRFQRQRPISGFIVDFYCAAANLVIEIDGSQHYTEEGQSYDNERSAVFERFGIEVVRYSNRDIDCNFYGVCEDIRHRVDQKLLSKQASENPLSQLR